MQDSFLPINATLCTSNSDICKVCHGNSCNTRKQFQECYSCSSETDSQCAKNPKLSSSKICDNYDSVCLVGIDENGQTRRQCKSEKSDSVENNFRKHFTCEDNKCNVNIFPKNRIKCYQCIGHECSNPLGVGEGTENPKKPETCSVYSRHDECFTYVNKGKIIQNERPCHLDYSDFFYFRREKYSSWMFD